MARLGCEVNVCIISLSGKDHSNTKSHNQAIEKTNKGRYISVPPSFILFGRFPDYLRVRGLTVFTGAEAFAGVAAVAAVAAGAFAGLAAEASTRTSRSSI